MKKIQILALSFLLLGAPSAMMADGDREGVETEMQAVSISVNGSNIHVTGANGAMLEVYNLTGVKIGSYRIDSNDKGLSISLQKGCYILKVGKVVRKISIR